MMHFSQACRRTIAGANPNNIHMAQLSDRFFLNVPGAWYNDTSCIDCGLCPEIAPGIFRRDDAHGQTFVWHQPQSEAELALAREAQQECPTESIGDDGIDPQP